MRAYVDDHPNPDPKDNNRPNHCRNDRIFQVHNPISKNGYSFGDHQNGLFLTGQNQQLLSVGRVPGTFHNLPDPDGLKPALLQHPQGSQVGVGDRRMKRPVRHFYQQHLQGGGCYPLPPTVR